MERIYHRYELWEDYKAGFYDNISGKNKKLLIDKVVELFSDQELTRKFMQKTIDEWPYSCEHNLSNQSLNRIAYLGQAACCLYGSVPFHLTMNAWNLLDLEIQERSNKIAKLILLQWERSMTTLKNGNHKDIQMVFQMSVQ